jgi:hypothetical protein
MSRPSNAQFGPSPGSSQSLASGAPRASQTRGLQERPVQGESQVGDRVPASYVWPHTVIIDVDSKTK